MKRYVFVIDGEVGPDLQFEETANARSTLLAAALSSNPKVIEVEKDDPVDVGWSWDGSKFLPPAN